MKRGDDDDLTRILASRNADGDDDADLQPLHPRDAMEMWIDRQGTERSEETIQSYYYRTKQFVEWCEEEDISNLNELTGRDIYRYDSARRADDLNQATLNTQLGTLRRFLEFCVDVEAVPVDLPLKVEVPQLAKIDRTNEEKLPQERAEVILESLERFKYASVDHALLALAWHTTARLGAIRSLDLRDCYLTQEDLERIPHEDDIQTDDIEGITTPFVFFRHRPDTDTPLKNKHEGERPVGLADDVGQLLQDYIEVNRDQVEDEYGRKALFSTQKGTGRLSKGGIRTRFNIITQPCRWGPCPHDRHPEECEATDHGYEARCPSSRSPHRVRTGSITWHRDCGWPPEVLAERANATPEVIRQHYDHPDLLKRMESRRSFIDQLEEGPK